MRSNDIVGTWGLLPTDTVIYKMNALVRRAFSRTSYYYNTRIEPRPESHWRILIIMSEGGTLNASELSEKALIDKFSVSRLVATLEEDGLVQRKPSTRDRRAVELCLTRAGKLLAGKVLKLGFPLTDDMLAALTPKELAVLERLVAKVYGRICELDRRDNIR